MTEQIVIDLLNNFQDNYMKYDVCTLRVSEVERFLTEPQLKVITGLIPDKVPTSSDIAVFNPYESDTNERFVRVSREIWQPFQELSLKCFEATEQRLVIESGYRSTVYQAFIYCRALYDAGFEIDNQRLVAPPSKSEHNLYPKHAIDVSLGGADDNFESSKALTWMLEHAGKYGFEMSYPQNNRSGIDYEPWHWRLF